mgnify:CR=1 FL=1
MRRMTIRQKFYKAIKDYNMLRDGDRVAVAVSGGWDSLTLLWLLEEARRKSGIEFDIIAVHILGDGSGPKEEPHPPLIEWLERFEKERGVRYVLEPFLISEGEKLPLNCFRCSWLRRKSLFTAAHKHGCNKLAFGHHMDDMVQTAILNLFVQGRLELMKISTPFFGGAIEVIRPLVYARKGEIKSFARRHGCLLYTSPSPRDRG